MAADRSKPEPSRKAVKAVRELGIERIRRHILLCGGPECCREKEGDAVWAYLKKRCKQVNAAASEEDILFRCKVKCLRVCTDGCIVVVYPDGIWYHHVDEIAIDRIIDEHIVNNQPVEDLILAREGSHPSR